MRCCHLIWDLHKFVMISIFLEILVFWILEPSSRIIRMIYLNVKLVAFRWDDAYELLNDMVNNRVSSIHQVIGNMIKGDYDDDSNWQMVEYVFDKLNSEGCELAMRFYNTLLEALWWLGQRERAARVLNEALKRGIFPGLLSQSKLVWSVDVHR